MGLRWALAVAAVAAFGMFGISGIEGIGAGEALAKQSNGMAGGNGNNANGAGNGNGQSTPKANRAPVADAGPDRGVQPGFAAILDGSGSFDPDGDPVTFSWVLVGRPAGSAAVLENPGTVRPRLVPDVAGTYEVQLVVEDGFTAGLPDSVLISTGNVAPAASAGRDAAADAGTVVTLDGAGSGDANGDTLSYGWSIVSAPAGSGASLSDPASPRPDLFVDVPGDYLAELTVDDGTASSRADRVTISTVNVPPVADAGANIPFDTAGAVALDAELTGDADGDVLSYRWTVLYAPANARYQLRDDSGRRATLLFDEPGDYVVQLAVTDGWGAESFDTVLMTSGNVAPVAKAGPDQEVVEDDEVVLDASGSHDADGDPLTARWALVSRPEGSEAAIARGGSVLAGFTADVAGTYVAQLIVNDGTQDSAPDTVVITTGNVAPVADAGPDLWVGAHEGATTLDGGASRDANGDDLTYRWALLQAPMGSKAAISNPESATVGFTPDRAGTYLAQLIVNDGTRDSAPDFVVIAKGYGDLDVGPGTAQGDGNGDRAPGIGHDINLRPVAVAGPGVTVQGGAFVQLDGGASHDPNGHPISYRWALIFKPAGSAAVLSDPGAADPSFAADVSGIYVAQLIVEDDQLASFPDTVLVYANTRPVAEAGPDQEVAIGSTVLLDGSGSFDSDGDALTYRWDFASKPAGSAAEIVPGAGAEASFVPDAFGDYVVRLVVDDGIEESLPDTMTVKTFNTPPVAEAGKDILATAGDLVTLDGTGSFDPDGQALSWRWRFTALPEGSAAALDDASAARPAFTADVEGLYVLDLVVSDGIAESAPDVVAVRVGDGTINSAPVLDPVGPLMVELGARLTVMLHATDPDGDAVYYFATPLPLPRNATLDAATGVFSFRPDADQTGSFTLTFGASDGIARDSESVTVTVTAPPIGSPTALTGRVIDADASAAGEILGVAGATVALVESGQVATTDAEGNFLLTGVPSGEVRLHFDGSTAALAPDGSAYGSLRSEVTLIHATLNRPDPFGLQRIDGAATGGGRFWFVNRSVTNSTTGVTLFIPGSIFQTRQALFTIYDAPQDEAAALSPSWVDPCQTTVIEPYGQVFNPVARITLQNRDNLAPGSIVTIWNSNPATGEFEPTGTGRVSADGSKVETVAGGIRWSTMAFAAPLRPRVALSADMNGGSLTPTLLADGNVTQAIALPGVTSLGEDRSQTLVYNSATADPRPVVAADTTILAPTGVPAFVEGSLEVGGVQVAGPFRTDTSNPAPLPEDEDATIRHAVTFDAGALPTGIHAYRFTATANYGCSKVRAETRGQIVVDNESDSPFGAGWTLAGLERLSFAGDGDILLTGGDGTAGEFHARPDGTFHPPVGHAVDRPGAGALDDLDGDGYLDMAVPERGQGNIVLLFGDGAGGFPRREEIKAGDIWREFPDVHTLKTGDFNNDGIRDIVVNNQISNQVRIYSGAGAGFFTLSRTLIVTRPQGLGVADFNGDGFDDFIVATSAGELRSHFAFVYLNDGAGGFLPRHTIKLGLDLLNVEIGDFDNNGFPDAAIASSDHLGGGDGPKIHIVLSDGAGGFLTATTAVAPIEWLEGRLPMAVADYNSDGNLDVALTVAGQDFFAVYFGDGAGGLGNPVPFPTGIGTANTLAAVDYDLDGDVDVVAGGRSEGAIVLFRGDGAGGLTVDGTIPIAPPLVTATLAGDFNGDEAPDLQTGTLDRVYALVADRTGANRFRSPGADFSTLSRNEDGTFTRRMTDGTTVIYNADGLMTARIDANGNRTDYTYGADGLLASISDPADPTRSTSFDYSGGSLSGLTDLGGRTTFFQVDADGNLISFADAESNVFRYAYDADSRLSAFASARGFVTSFDYGFAGQYLGTTNPDGTSVTASVTRSLGLPDDGGAGAWVAPEDRIATLTDARGNTYEFEVNEYGFPIRTRDPVGRETLIERDANNLVVRTVAPADGSPDGTLVTELAYDERGNVTAKTEAAGTALARTTRFEYEPVFSRTTRITDPAGGVTAMEYDSNGNLLRVTDAEGGVQEYTYDARGLRLTATDQNGNITRFVYDFFGNIQTSTNGAGEVTKMLRDAAGNVTGVTEGFGTAAARTTSYVFDDLGRIVAETDGEGGVMQTVFDADGNKIAEIDATGIASESEYDEMGRLAAESHPATGTVRRTYDENGNLASMIDPTGNIAHFEYDAANRAVRTEDPAGGIRAFAYDSQDNPVQVTDANGNATYFRYDALGREVERRNALDDTWSFAYDSRDNMVETLDAKGQRIAKAFDALNRMTQVELFRADGSREDTQRFAYDAMGQKVSARDDDSSLAWSYDGANRVATAETLAGLAHAQPATVLTHSYDAAGNRASLADSEGGTTWFDHDAVGRLARVTTARDETIELTYDAAGRLERIAWPTAAGMRVTYGAETGRPDSIAQTRGAAELERFDYGFDTDGKITSIADAGGVRNFTYDATLQLTGGGYASNPETYAWDAEGNRTSSHLSGSYTHDTANRLREDDEACYDYDANGNLVSKTGKLGTACAEDVTTYTWDVLNRLVAIDFPDGSAAEYRYDAQGRRIGKSVNGVLTTYVYDGEAILLEYDGAGALQARYTHGEEVDQPLAMARGGGSYFYHTDHLGSVRLLTDGAGAIVSRYDYDAFGNLEATSFEGVANPYGFTARERDAESGLMFYRARYYDPELGRFISEDPIGFEGGDANLYRYVWNDPVNGVDPTGMVANFELVMISIKNTVGNNRYDKEFRAASTATLVGAAAIGVGTAYLHGLWADYAATGDIMDANVCTLFARGVGAGVLAAYLADGGRDAVWGPLQSLLFAGAAGALCAYVGLEERTLAG